MIRLSFVLHRRICEPRDELIYIADPLNPAKVLDLPISTKSSGVLNMICGDVYSPSFIILLKVHGIFKTLPFRFAEHFADLKALYEGSMLLESSDLFLGVGCYITYRCFLYWGIIDSANLAVI